MSALEIALLVVVALAATSIVVSTLRLGISPLPSSRRATRALLALLPADVRGTIVELGSGWGGLAIALARARPAARVIGYERSPVPWLVSRVRRALGRVRNLELRRRDFRREDLRGAATVVAYLFPRAMTALAERLPRELAGDAIVLSHTFRMPGWTPEVETALDDAYRTAVFRYRVGDQPAAVDRGGAFRPQ